VVVVASGSLVDSTIEYIHKESAELEDDITIKMKGVDISAADRILRKEVAFNRAVGFSNVEKMQVLYNVFAEMAEKIEALEEEVERLKGVKL
jgi:hypothetical protein